MAVDMTENLNQTRKIEQMNLRLLNAEKIGKSGYFERDLNTEKVYWSEGLYQILQIEPEKRKESLETFLNFVHPDDKAAFTDAYWAARNGLQNMHLEHRLVLKDGVVKNVLNKGFLVLDEQEKPLRFEGVVQDITQIKQMEKHLLGVNQKLEAAQQIAQLGYWEFDVDTQKADLSQSVYEIWELESTGPAPDFFTFLRCVHPEDRILFTPSLDKLYAMSDYREVEHRIITPNGTEKWIFQRIHLIRDRKGKPKRMEAVVQDVTIPKRKDIELRMSHRRFEMAMQVTHEVIWDWDILTDHTTRSEGYFTLFGLQQNKGAADTSAWLQQIHSEDQSAVRLHLNKSLKDSKIHRWEMEYRFVRGDGKTAYIQDRATILRDKYGKAVRMVGSMRDVTAEREQINRIQQQNEALKKIAWIQSHDVRAPLANIMGIVELMERFTNVDSEQLALLEQLRLAAYQFDHIIHDITKKAEAIKW
jgi:PAS domain S-box-containing protein